jgi:hypothetical protein
MTGSIKARQAVPGLGAGGFHHGAAANAPGR